MKVEEEGKNCNNYSRINNKTFKNILWEIISLKQLTYKLIKNI